MESSHLGSESHLLANLALEAFERCQQAAAFTENPGQITRTFCSPAMAQLHGAMQHWMKSAGMTCRVDAAGNLWGRLNSVPSADSRSLIIGSHLDTVPNGGKYDGLLGVMLGIALAEAIHRTGTKLPFSVEVVGFSEEEGVRFGTPFIGSRAVVAECDGELLQRTDVSQTSVSAALQSFGCDPTNVKSAEVKSSQVLAYLEPHIEQGPVLESNSLPLGVVTSIAGQTRAVVHFHGAAGHAGTVPMHLRRDALAAAAEWILAVEGIANRTEGLVATVGVIEVLAGAGNVIPGEVHARLDVRHADDGVRSAAVTVIEHRGNHIAGRRRVDFKLSVGHEHQAAAMNGAIAATLEQSLRDMGLEPLRLVSGAGHDAAVMARRFPTGMLFIRCAGGLSHHPDESVSVADVTAALTALWHLVQRLAQQQTATTSD